MINEPDKWSDLGQEMAVWRNRFLRLLDRSPAPTAISQSDGLLVISNPAFSALWGLTPGHMRGRNLLDLLVSPDEGSLLKLSEVCAPEALMHVALAKAERIATAPVGCRQSRTCPDLVVSSLAAIFVRRCCGTRG